MKIVEDWEPHILRRFHAWVQFGQPRVPEQSLAVFKAKEFIAEESVTNLKEFLSLDIEGLWE